MQLRCLPPIGIKKKKLSKKSKKKKQNFNQKSVPEEQRETLPAGPGGRAMSLKDPQEGGGGNDAAPGILDLGYSFHALQVGEICLRCLR